MSTLTSQQAEIAAAALQKYGIPQAEGAHLIAMAHQQRLANQARRAQREGRMMIEAEPASEFARMVEIHPKRAIDF